MAMPDISSLPPGFGFHPTDEELICHYLKRKVLGQRQEGFEVIREIDLYRFEPWDLPGKSLVPTRDSKWHFFSPRDVKYPNGSRKNRATEAGYWKATGKDRNIRSAKRVVGTKKTLVFHEGRAPRGKRTDWVMHEYHLDEKECGAQAAGMHESYVLCRIAKKDGLDSQHEQDAAAETEMKNCSPKETVNNPLCEPKLEEGSAGGVGEVALDGEDSIEKWLNSILDDYDYDPWIASYAQTSESELKVNLETPKAEDFAIAAISDQEFPVQSGCQEAESGIFNDLEKPCEFHAENSEIESANEEQILAEFYQAATGLPLDLQQSMADGVSLSDFDFHDEPSPLLLTSANGNFNNHETGIEIRRRTHEVPKEFRGPRIRMQVHKMESAATGVVETCTYEDQTIAVLSEHDDSNYEPREQLLLLGNFSKKSAKTEQRVVFESSGPSSGQPESKCKLKPTWTGSASSTVLRVIKDGGKTRLSEIDSGVVSTAGTDSVPDTTESSKPAGSPAISGSSLRWLSSSVSSDKEQAVVVSTDYEQTRGGVCGFMFHLRRYLSTGLSWLLPASCVVGTSLPLVFLLLRNICRFVKGTSTLNL